MTLSFRPRMLSVCTLVVLALTGPAHAATDWPVPLGPSREPVPFRYHPSQWKKVPREFLDDAAAVTLYYGNTYLLEADGTVETITHEITRFNGRKAIEKLGEYRQISYTPSYEKLTLNLARVLKADGRMVTIEPKHVQLRDISTDYQVYDHGKQLIISFPNLEVGDAIEVKWTTRGKNPEYLGHFFTRYTFGDDDYPLVLDELRIRVPKEKPFKYATVGGKLEPVVREEGETRTYYWRVTNQRQRARDENAPSRESLRLQVACSTFSSWDEVCQWKRRLRAECWQCTPELRKVVAEVTRDLATPLEKARALTYWVRRNIRYVSSGEKHDYTPHAPALVLANRYGDCKDTSQLLAVMLREAGVPVALVTIGAQDDGQILPELPSPWGTHAMLLVTLDGKEHWIDTTVSLAAWDYLPRDDRGRVAYVIDDKGLRLTRTPVLRPEGNRIVQTTNVTIGSDGSVRMERDIIAYGSAALARREEWVEVPAGERRRLMTVELQDANSRARLRELLINEKTLHDFDQPASARVVFEIPGHFSGEPEREGSLTDSAIWARILSYHLDPDRKMPLELGAPFESVHRYRVQLPPAFRLDHVPSNRQVRSPWGFFRLTVTADEDRPRQLELVFHTRLDKVLVSPSQFDAWRRFHDDLLKQYRVWLTLRPTTDLADAPALEALLAVAPGDSDSAATLVQLYLRHGKYEPARRVLRRARVYHPNDPALAELTVKTALGLKEEEEAYRELVRLFPDEPRYAVSLGQVLVDRDNGEGARSVLQPVADNAAPTWSSQAHHQLARLCFKEGKPVAALEHLEAARKASADTANTVSVWLLQGRVCERLERPRAAAEAYRQALQLDPNSAETLAALVQLSMASKATGQALDYLRRYTVVVGDDGEGLAQAAEFHRRLGRAEDALELANRARQHGEEILANRVLGLVYLQRGDHVRALACLEQTERDGPVLAGLIRCQLALGRLRAAERLVESAEQIKQPTPELARACALTLSLGQRRAALSREIEVPEEKAEIWERALDRVICAEEALERGRPVAQVEALVGAAFADGVAIGLAFALRGQLALERGRLRRALEDGDRAIKLSPKEPRGYLVRGRARLERGENGAVADLTRAAELSGGKDATVLHWLAAAMYRDGALNEALRTQREAVKLRPRDAELAEQLKELEKAVKTVVPERSPGK